ncbi:MAG: D-threonine aldolase [Chitinophagaceae bacterium]|nr:D-threonine aldolase [Chitinophagaceae bacterium]
MAAGDDFLCKKSKLKRVAENWYHIKHIEELDTPALAIFPERVKKNIQTAITMVKDVARLRPHVKTHKSPDVSKLMMEAGITKFKCATIAEAEMLGQCGAKDVVLAYQPLGPKLKRFIELIEKYPATIYSCLTDNLSAVNEQSEAFLAKNLKVPVYIDLNIGMNRTGIVPGNEAMELYKYCANLEGIIVAGLHAYDGHLRSPDIIERTRECNEGFAPVEKMKAALEKSGYAVPNVIAGGSPSFPVHAKRNHVECSPGTFIYWDKGYRDLCAEQDFLTAAVLVTRVISLPSATRITTDLGHKSVSAENEITKRIYFLNGENLKPVGQSEEHLVLEVPENHSYKLGDVLYGIPFHICPTIALYERASTIENGTISGEWKNIARDRKITV